MDRTYGTPIRFTLLRRVETRRYRMRRASGTRYATTKTSSPLPAKGVAMAWHNAGLMTRRSFNNLPPYAGLKPGAIV